MNKAIAILGGLGASVAAAYFLDPKKGASRRANVLDKFNTFKEDASNKLSEMSEGMNTKGMIGDGGQRIQSQQPGQQSGQRSGQQSGQQSQQFKPGTPGHSTGM